MRMQGFPAQVLKSRAVKGTMLEANRIVIEERQLGLMSMALTAAIAIAV